MTILKIEKSNFEKIAHAVFFRTRGFFRKELLSQTILENVKIAFFSAAIKMP